MAFIARGIRKLFHKERVSHHPEQSPSPVLLEERFSPDKKQFVRVLLSVEEDGSQRRDTYFGVIHKEKNFPLMRVQEVQTSGSSETKINIFVEAIVEIAGLPYLTSLSYFQEDGGAQQPPFVWKYPQIPPNFSREEWDTIWVPERLSLGVRNASELPQEIESTATAQAFFAQLERRDWSRPQLIAKASPSSAKTAAQELR